MGAISVLYKDNKVLDTSTGWYDLQIPAGENYTLLGYTIHRDVVTTSKPKYRFMHYNQQIKPVQERVLYLRNELRNKWKEEIDELAKLKDGWDEEDGYAIMPSIISIAKTVVKQMPQNLLSQWWIYPNPNGTLILEANASIRLTLCIGTNGISWFGINGEKREKGSTSDNNPESIIEKLEYLTQKLL